mmetsp:Transcript_117869/g.319935  ORF Transcript_117869/g.319935 Transcript_117869/m.319935 type:complete len:88 (-) Transcript_117869:1911-2174(-)
MRASTDSISRWLVGSSSISTCGARHVMLAKQTLAFCPPDSSLMGRVWPWEGSPNWPRHLWASSELLVPAPNRRSSGLVRNSTALMCR